MSYIKELTETNPVSLLDPLWSTTPTTTAIFQFLQVVLLRCCFPQVQYV